MREEIANQVYPIINYALSLKERLDYGERADMRKEQAALMGLLGSEMEAKRFTDYGGDHSTNIGNQSIMASQTGGSYRSSDFMGIRYALACWLDELFVLDSPWGADWNEYKIETAFFRSNDRAFKFWDQARLAEARPNSDALEVFFLCVMLGFRGDYREQPDELQKWITVTQSRLAKSLGKDPPLPGNRELPGDATPRHAIDAFRRMVMILTLTLLIVVPISIFLLTTYVFN
jgi:type VI secretion system protein ImpK